MFGLPLPLVGLSLLLSIGLCVHVVRTHQSTFWLWIILMFQPLGGVVYVVAVLVPAVLGGTRARRMGAAARDALDPGRAYRAARAAYDDVPSVQNGLKLAEAAAELGRWSEAETRFAAAMQGLYADDPTLVIGRARALLELDRAAAAVELLERLSAEEAKSPRAALVRARALHAVGRHAEAEAAFTEAMGRLPGLEGLARYAAFLAAVGRRDEAKATLAEIERRAAKTRAQFRKEAMSWRDFAAAKVAA